MLRNILVTALLISSSSHASEFSKFVDDYFAGVFSWHPSLGTVVGFHEYDAKVSDRSMAAISERVRRLKEEKAKLPKLADLSPDDKIDADLIANAIDSELLDLEEVKSQQNNPMFYATLVGDAVDGLIKRDFAPARDRLKSVVARLDGIAPLMAQMQQNLQDPAKELTDLGVTILEGSGGFLAHEVAAWGNEAAGKDKAARAGFTAANARAQKAVGDAVAWMKKDLLPRSKGSFALGTDRFLRKLRYDDRVSIPLEELRKIGERQMTRDYEKFVATAKQIDPKKSPAEVMKAITLDHPKEGELAAKARSTIEEIVDFLVAKKIVTLPTKRPPKILDTPSFLRSQGFAMMDAPGPFEKKATDAFYYVTPPEADWDATHKEEHLRLFNGPVLKIITVHEAYPGHYVQFLYAPRFPTKTRKILACNSNVEGWAHYSEQMLVEEGYGAGDPKMALAQLSEALVRDARYVVGIGLHTAGMSVEQGTKIFMEKAFLERATAYEEARRGTYDPLYIDYTLGKLMIYKLREDYRAAKGKELTLERFHDDFLKQGGIPIPVVRRLLLPGDDKPVL